jgi:hypothetical protein
MSTLLQLLPGSLPENFHPEGWQDFYNRIMELGRAVWPESSTTVNYGSTAPTGAYISFPWIRTNPVTGIFDRVYNYVNGMWLSPHPIPPDSEAGGQYFITMWSGTPAALLLYQGGTADPVTAYTGAFWEVYAAMAAKIPIGVGTLIDTGTVLALGDTGGEERHTLIEAELPTLTLEQGPILRLTYTGPFDVLGGTTCTSTPAPYTIGSDTPHNNMPPYKAIYFIKRTLRKYYTA